MFHFYLDCQPLPRRLLVARVLNNARMNTDTSATQTASFVLPADTSPGTYLGRWDWVPANGGKERGEGVLRFVRSSSFFAIARADMHRLRPPSV